MRSSCKYTDGRKLAVLIPAMNEVSTIAQIVREVREEIHGEVVVIDDASTDDTQEAARSAGATVLPLTLRLGTWGAIRTGLSYAFKHGYQIAVTMDADGQHSADSIHSVVAPIESNRADVLIASCPQRASAARNFAWAFFRKLSRLDLEDLTSGFRAYNRTAISALILEDTALLDYQDIGVLLYLQKKGFRISEIQVNMYCRVSGRSKVFSSWCAVLEYLLLTGILCLSKRK
jgi:glycosyltransferase involved in cell wall biosynthesis